MHILAISGANIRHQPKGMSVTMAELMLNVMAESINDLKGEVVALVDKRIEPCIGCAGCVGSGLCTISDDFGSIYAAMKTADALIFVSPHYAPIPAKLCALLERVEVSRALSAPINVTTLGGGSFCRSGLVPPRYRPCRECTKISPANACGA